VASGEFIDMGSGEFVDQASGEFVDQGSGEFSDVASGEFADQASGEFADQASGGGRPELDYDGSRGLGRTAPYALSGCVVGSPGCAAAAPSTASYHRNQVSWTPSPVGHTFQYLVQRKRGLPSSPYAWTQIATSPTPTFVDGEELPDGVQFSYRVRAEF